MVENHAVGTNPLSNDIKLLGGLLGKIIQEQHGPEALELVETIRIAAKARRNNEPEAARVLEEAIKNTSLAEKQILIKAFGNYFQLINITEDQQRIRVLREREANGDLHDDIDTSIQQLRQKGLSAGQMRDVLEQLRLRFVLTAHPSEAKRKEVLVKLRHIAQMMTEHERIDLLPREERRLLNELSEEIEELWQTRLVRATQKQVADEVDFGVYFITSVIMDTVVELYDDLYDSLATHFPEEDWSNLHRLLRYGSWIGGDRDGNPNVTVDVTLQTLKTMRDAARKVYLEEILFLRDHLTQHTDEMSITEELRSSLETGATESSIYISEVYREKLDQIWQRLNADQYRSRLSLLDDLYIIQTSLREHKGLRVANGRLRQLIRKIRLFGLYLAPLDIREDARLQAAALAELFRHYGITDDYLSLSEEAKQKLLTDEINSPRPFFPNYVDQFSDATQRIIATWRMIATAHTRFSTGVIDTVISSMSQQPSDVLGMLLMAKEAGVDAELDLVPLFETIDDLERAPVVIRTLFDNETYMTHLQKRNLRQQIMIGYSDSSKDGGYIASNWHLYKAQDELARVCAECGISVELFHGRGGSIGRGGGPSNRAILSQPPASLRGGIKITEQGEVIAYRYSNEAITRRHLNQVMNAVILSLGNASDDGNVRSGWPEYMEKLSEYGRVVYRDLVYETDGFLDYWQQATPINELSQLRISSRPAKRSGQGGFAAMRAIPWVFSWMQSRAIIPSWFGVGSAMARFIEETPNGLEELKAMYREWRFFSALIENTQLDVAKADMGIMELYAALVTDEVLREEIFSRIRDEHQLTARMICAITDQKELLDNTTALKLSIERRNPYVDPLNFMQVELLKQLRQTNPDSPEYTPILEAILATINGIAAGMKTTG